MKEWKNVQKRSDKSPCANNYNFWFPNNHFNYCIQLWLEFDP